MPDGIVQWFDTESGEGRVLHRRRRYAVSTSDIEPDARVPGARVHFDIDHTSGGTSATGVTLRRGIRSSKGQRRFGDTTGAPTDAAKKPITTSHESFDQDPTMFRSPVRAAEFFASQMSIGDLDEVMVLYSPTATLHTGGRILFGLDEIRRHWQRSSLLGAELAPSVRGDQDGTVLIRWPAQQGERAHSRLQISRGEITEQWQGAVDGAETVEEDALPVEISVDGQVTQRSRERALERMRKVLEKVDAPVLHVRIRLVNAVDSGRDEPALASIMLDINGDPIRAEMSHTDLDAAIDSLGDRLKHQIERMTSLRDTLRRRGPGSASGEWRHGDLPTERPAHYPRPVEERQVVRHKTFTTVEATIDEAIFDMESLDYDFFLYTDLASGQEGFITRGEEGIYQIRLQEGLDEDTFVRTVASAIEPHAEGAPTLSLAEARGLLDENPDPWVFFSDADSARGHVLYRRYDGHYGLLTPRSEPDGPADGADNAIQATASA